MADFGRHRGCRKTIPGTQSERFYMNFSYPLFGYFKSPSGQLTEREIERERERERVCV